MGEASKGGGSAKSLLIQLLCQFNHPVAHEFCRMTPASERNLKWLSWIEYTNSKCCTEDKSSDINGGNLNN